MDRHITKEQTLSSYKPLSAVRINGQLCLTNEKGEPIARHSEDEYARVHNIMRSQKLNILDDLCALFDQGASPADMFERVFGASPNTSMSDKEKANAVDLWYKTWNKKITEYESIETGIPYDYCPLCREELKECPGHHMWILDGSLLRQCPNGHVFESGRHPSERNINECVIDRVNGVQDACYPGFSPLRATGNIWRHDNGNWIKRVVKNA